MQDVYKNIEEYNVDKERKILIVFDDMIPDMINNKKVHSVVTELFNRGRKLNISLVFIMKIPNKSELQQIAQKHSSNISNKDLINIHKKYTAKPYSFLVDDTTFASDDALRFRKNLFNI